MTKNKTTMNTEVRQAYEPVKVKVMKVSPQGVLCQSGGDDGGEKSATLESYSIF